jgi:hypothetical protein
VVVEVWTLRAPKGRPTTAQATRPGSKKTSVAIGPEGAIHRQCHPPRSWCPARIPEEISNTWVEAWQNTLSRAPSGLRCRWPKMTSHPLSYLGTPSPRARFVPQLSLDTGLYQGRCDRKSGA